jgi:hypothetical protein
METLGILRGEFFADPYCARTPAVLKANAEWRMQRLKSEITRGFYGG